jgi:hypothetical protein
LAWSMEQVAGWVAFGLAIAIGAGVAQLRLADDAQSVEPPPSDPEALLAWLEAQAPPTNESALGADAWPGLRGQPVIATWARQRIDISSASVSTARGLAVHAIPLLVLRRLAPTAGLDPEAAAILLDPEIADIVATACPNLDPPLTPAMCHPEGREVALAGLERTLTGWFTAPQIQEALWAIELTIGLGERGTLLARTIERDAEAGPAGDRARASALIVQAWTLPPELAAHVLVRHAKPGDPLAPVAALELARLGLEAPLLEQLAEEAHTPADAALAQLAADVAAERQAPESPPRGLLNNGL